MKPSDAARAAFFVLLKSDDRDQFDDVMETLVNIEFRCVRKEMREKGVRIMAGMSRMEQEQLKTAIRAREELQSMGDKSNGNV